MPTITARAMVLEDRFEVAELIYASMNVWYQQLGLPPIFVGGPRITEIQWPRSIVWTDHLWPTSVLVEK